MRGKRGTMTPHGSASTYTNHHCRCDECKAAWNAYVSKRRMQRVLLVAESGLPEGVEHGEHAYNNWGCCCNVCTAAHAEAARRWRST
jgi:hypothetical protein